MTNIRITLPFLTLNAKVSKLLEDEDPVLVREMAVLLMEQQLPMFHEFAQHLIEVEAVSFTDECEDAADGFGLRLLQVAWEASVFDGAAYYEDMRADEERDEA
jgi:hypothetical protein